jgi:Sulfotransferase domain
VKRVTPPNRVHFFNVAEGWEPLCKILNVPVPDEPFPRINDKDQVQKDIQGLVIKGVIGWLQIFGVFGAMVVLMAYALK